MTNILFIILLFPSITSASELWQVQSPFSSSHTENIPSMNNSITVEWSAPSGLTPSFTEGYYVSFSSPLKYTFTESDTASTIRGVGEILKLNKSSGSTNSFNVIGEGINGTGIEPYYFNIAVLDDMEIPFTPGVTIHLGPYFIDTEAPKFPSISTPQTTSSSNIPITLGASGASLMCISESGYGNCGALEWKDYTTNCYWSVSEGEGVKNIYVQFKDVAGNTSNAFSTTLYEIENTFSGAKDVVAYAIPALNEWGIFLFIILMITSALYSGKMVRPKKIYPKIHIDMN